MELTFYRCKHCGNIITQLKASGAPVSCCEQVMEPLVPCTSDGAHEKHVPVYTAADGVVHVAVGSVEHPMLEKHYIQWIALQTKQGVQIKYLQPNEAPKADFALTAGDETEAVYEYCNLHGLWKA